MLVSAIAQNNGQNYYNFSNNNIFYNTKNNETIGDTVFNSLTPFANRRTVPTENSTQMFENINKWKDFCHKQIIGEKLNIIA